MKKIIVTVFLVGGLSGVARAEFGVSAGTTFNHTAKFRSATDFRPRATDPGLAISGVDHFYDDGFNRVDSSGNFGNETTYWGYQNNLQDNGGSLTMNSSQTLIDPRGSSEQSEWQPALELYWQEDLTGNKTWNLGIRAAVRWQRISVDHSAHYSTTIETIHDTYSYTGILPGDPFNGSFGGPNFLLSDTPVRSITSAAGQTVLASRKLNAYIFGLDVGPTFSVNFTDNLRLSTSSGGTFAWINSEFDYSEGSYSRGSDTKQDWLFGAYASADLIYLIGERWGIFGGAAYSYIQDFEQRTNGRSAEIEFGGSYTLRAGFFFR